MGEEERRVRIGEAEWERLHKTSDKYIMKSREGRDETKYMYEEIKTTLRDGKE